MSHRARFIFALLSKFVISSWAAEAVRPAVILENAEARVTVDLNGGAIGEFRLKSNPVNPLNWAAPKAGDLAIGGFGHFLCLDRWGPPSEAEGKHGMPYHGEASHVIWKLSRAPEQNQPEAEITATLPMAGFSVRRQIQIAATGAVFQVRESVTNEKALGRMFNMVQHPTIAPPFLDEETIVDCNGHRGFAQGGKLPNPEEPSSLWPQAFKPNGQKVDVRHLSSDPAPNVVTYKIDEDHGWITAVSPHQRLLIGYFWKTSDYPWVSLWRDTNDGKPAARGLEFGTTGLHQPFPVLAQKPRIWELPTFAWLDASATFTKSYTAFLLPVPADFAGVQSVDLKKGALIVREYTGGKNRVLETSTAGLTVE